MRTPDWTHNLGRKYKRYNFAAMQVGQVKVIPVDEQGCRTLKSFRALVWNRSRQLGFDLVCRMREDGAFEVYRRK